MLIYNMLSKKYKDKRVVDNLDIRINEKDIVGFLGPNGAGKTTTIKMSCGLITPTSGDIECYGYSLKEHRNHYLKNIGAVLEGNRNIYWKLSPVENMEYFAGIKGIGRKKVKNQIDKYIEMFDLKEKRNIECGKLSRGMQQKVAISCSLIHDPKVLFLDEPTLGLDIHSVLLIRETLKQLGEEERVIIITSHDLNFISSLCNRIIIINNGLKVLDENIGFLKNYSEDIIYIIKTKRIGENLKKDMQRKFTIYIKDYEDTSEIEIMLDSENKIHDFLHFLKINNINIKDMYKVKIELEDIFTKVINNRENNILTTKSSSD
ncbi:ABC transporter ATP-binding protein [Anaerosalibacter bizertensis]|uniref:ABC transporter ATP-binding protein n=1 Tax=Anaerosalibacter bizertensis TaxID=932217 RepID=A0A844FI73_9FIRM|nr:ABC transporter ATP-binding protein [Anaerosalibacter bizertensis]MSS43689.1 ABC transporter ATP-binding protein [Anaerosalibacter bizertensis]